VTRGMHLCSACNRHTTNALDDDDDKQNVLHLTTIWKKAGTNQHKVLQLRQTKKHTN